MEKPRVFTWADLKATIPSSSTEAKPTPTPTPAPAPAPVSAASGAQSAADASRSSELLEITYAKLNRVQQMREKTEAQQKARLESQEPSTSPSRGGLSPREDAISARPPPRSPGLGSRSAGPKNSRDLAEKEKITQLKLKLNKAGMIKTTTPASAYSKANREIKLKQRVPDSGRSHSVDPSRKNSETFPMRSTSVDPAHKDSTELDRGRFEEQGTDPRKAWTESLRGSRSKASAAAAAAAAPAPVPKIKPKTQSVSARRTRPGSSAPPQQSPGLRTPRVVSRSPAREPPRERSESQQGTVARHERSTTRTSTISDNEDLSAVKLGDEQVHMVDMFQDRFKAQGQLRLKLEELTKSMEREEENSGLALRQFVRFHAKTQQSWEVEKTLLETKVIELENVIASEQEEREKSTRLMREFKRDGGDVIKKLRESLHNVSEKYKHEVESSITIAEQLHSVQCDYEALREQTGDISARNAHVLDAEKLEGAMMRERRMHQTECEALEMKLQELSLMSDEENKINDQLRVHLDKANADRARLQAELESRSKGGMQSSRSGDMWGALAEVGVEADQPTTLEEANNVIQAMVEHLKSERDMRLQTEEQTAVMQQQFESSMGLLENQNKDLANKLQLTKGDTAQKSRSIANPSPRSTRAPAPAAKPPKIEPVASSQGPVEVSGDVDLAELKEEMMRTITSIQKSLDNEGNPTTA